MAILVESVITVGCFLTLALEETASISKVSGSIKEQVLQPMHLFWSMTMTVGMGRL